MQREEQYHGTLINEQVCLNHLKGLCWVKDVVSTCCLTRCHSLLSCFLAAGFQAAVADACLAIDVVSDVQVNTAK